MTHEQMAAFILNKISSNLSANGATISFTEQEVHTLREIAFVLKSLGSLVEAIGKED